MDVVEIGEPIAVLAAFSGGDIRPVAFDWHKKHYRVDAVNGRWIDRTRQCPTRHFSVQVGDETYIIHLAADEAQWWLDQVITE